MSHVLVVVVYGRGVVEQGGVKFDCKQLEGGPVIQSTLMSLGSEELFAIVNFKIFTDIPLAQIMTTS